MLFRLCILSCLSLSGAYRPPILLHSGRNTHHITMQAPLGRRSLGALAAGSAALVSASKVVSPASAEEPTPWPYSELSNAIEEDRVKDLVFKEDGTGMLVRHALPPPQRARIGPNRFPSHPDHPPPPPCSHR